jgi:hypothetical protein
MKNTILSFWDMIFPGTPTASRPALADQKKIPYVISWHTQKKTAACTKK